MRKYDHEADSLLLKETLILLLSMSTVAAAIISLCDIASFEGSDEVINNLSIILIYWTLSRIAPWRHLDNLNDLDRSILSRCRAFSNSINYFNIAGQLVEVINFLICRIPYIYLAYFALCLGTLINELLIIKLGLDLPIIMSTVFGYSILGYAPNMRAPEMTDVYAGLIGMYDQVAIESITALCCWCYGMIAMLMFYCLYKLFAGELHEMLVKAYRWRPRRFFE
jgi:hypothetical protein